MKNKVFLVILFAVLSFQLTAYAEVVIISNKNFYADTLSKKEIKQIFLGKKKSFGIGKNIYLVLFNEKQIHSEFLKKMIGRSPDQFRNYWRMMLFTGHGILPRRFKSVEKLIDHIASTEGAIGYVNAEAVTQNVKVITIN